MAEVEAILNSRFLTPVTLDPRDHEPLNPNNLLLQTGSATPAPGVFRKDDCFARGHWRQMQWMIVQLWRRWSRVFAFSSSTAEMDYQAKQHSARQCSTFSG